MRLMTVHNFCGSIAPGGEHAPSGENVAYCAERDLLIRRGFQVEEFIRRIDVANDGSVAGLLRTGLSVAWNPFAARALRQRVLDFRPDVVHVHNTFPLISPSIFWALRELPAAVVMTVHNFRIACATAMLFRDDHACTSCMDRRSVLPAIEHACYRGSRLSTLPVAASIALHRRLETWRNCIDAFVTLTEFQKTMLVRAGLPAAALFVKANLCSAPVDIQPWGARSQRALFVGRVGHEKGLDLLLEAWRLWGDTAPALEVIGAGPELEHARAFVNYNGLSGKVVLNGAMSYEATQRRIAAGRLLIVPSRVFEGYPMVVCEAFSLGVPVAASDIGSLRQIVEDDVVGRRFPPQDPRGLLSVVRSLWEDQQRLQAMGQAARRRYEEAIAPEPNLRRLEEIYVAAKVNRLARNQAR